jgi:putative transposase
MNATQVASLCHLAKDESRLVVCNLHQRFTNSRRGNRQQSCCRSLTEQRLRRGSFHNVKELIQAIGDYISGHNQNPCIFVWSASVERILTKVAKCKEALDPLH